VNVEPLSFVGQDEAEILELVEPEHRPVHSRADMGVGHATKKAPPCWRTDKEGACARSVFVLVSPL
jgi:hypothetical protein